VIKESDNNFEFKECLSSSFDNSTPEMTSLSTTSKSSFSSILPLKND